MYSNILLNHRLNAFVINDWALDVNWTYKRCPRRLYSDVLDGFMFKFYNLRPEGSDKSDKLVV